jgi:hypothetical protein
MVLAVSGAASAFELEPPEIGGTVAIDFVSYAEDSTWSPQGVFVEAPNRFLLRKVSVHVAGQAGSIASYEAEAGIASCGGGSTVSVHEAVLLLHPWGDGFRFGIGQLHGTRGFTMGEECTETLLAEKPPWFRTVAPVCHTLGALVESDIPMDEAGSLSIQAAYFNGPSGTLEEQYDALFWLRYDLPLEGLAVGGFYEDMKMEMDATQEGPEPADRFGGGIDYSSPTLLARVEYVGLKGIPAVSRLAGIEDNPQDIENTGLMAQAGYRIETDLFWLTAVTPYAGYEAWNRWSNAPSGDYEFSEIHAGVRLDVSDDAGLVVEWNGPASTPDEMPEASSVLTLRLGVGF